MSPTSKWVIGGLTAAFFSLLFWMYGVLSSAVERVEDSNREILKTVYALEGKMDGFSQMRSDLQRIQERFTEHLLAKNKSDDSR